MSNRATVLANNKAVNKQRNDRISVIPKTILVQIDSIIYPSESEDKNLSKAVLQAKVHSVDGNEYDMSGKTFPINMDIMYIQANFGNDLAGKLAALHLPFAPHLIGGVITSIRNPLYAGEEAESEEKNASSYLTKQISKNACSG